jgi:hypothetical protein
MQHLDPSAEYDVEWAALTDRQRDFYRLCVKTLLFEKEAVLCALGMPSAYP